MGQYWGFANIDKKQSWGWTSGKMGEFFFMAQPHVLLQLFIVPVVPLDSERADSVPWPHQPEDDLVAIPGSWAGDRVICLGDYARNWPDSIAKDLGYTEDMEYDVPEDPSAEMAYHPWSPLGFMTACDRVKLCSPLSKNSNAAFPTDSVWVLRNLTKKEYVLSSGIPNESEDEKGRTTLEYFEAPPLDSSPGLGHVLVSRIGWSSDSSCSMAWERSEELSAGIWAGDKIDVRALTQVQEEIAKEEWKDVSRREAERLYDIWIDEGECVPPLPDDPKGTLDE